MKLKKSLRGYYREQVVSVVVEGSMPAIKKRGGGSHPWLAGIAFHGAVIGLIVSAMIAGLYQPSHLEERMFIIVDRYKIEDRMVSSFEDLITIIQKGRSDGGKK